MRNSVYIYRMKRSRKQKIFYAAALLFCAVFPFLLRGIYGQPLFDRGSLLFSAGGVLIAMFTIGIFNKVLIYNSNKSAGQLKKQLIPSYLFIVLATVLFALPLFSLMIYLSYKINGLDTTGFLRRLIQNELPTATLALLGGIFLETIAFFFTVWRQAIERQQQLLEETLKYKYKTLKAQVNPHFLFNSLNTLSEIVYVDARKADHYIQKLAGVYRYILDHEETDLTALDEELRFVQRYFELQQERDGERIRLEIDFPHTERYQIVPISLQILLENALKHNSASEEKPLLIRIYASEGYVVVANAIRKRSTLSDSHGTGLANLAERLRLITGKEMVREMKDNQFIVKLPLV